MNPARSESEATSRRNWNGWLQVFPIEIDDDITRMFTFRPFFIEDAVGHINIDKGILPLPDFIEKIDNGVRLRRHRKVVFQHRRSFPWEELPGSLLRPEWAPIFLRTSISPGEKGIFRGKTSCVAADRGRMDEQNEGQRKHHGSCGSSVNLPPLCPHTILCSVSRIIEALRSKLRRIFDP